MKKLIAISCMLMLFVACDKNDQHEDENECPILTRENVPSTVTDNFDARYSNATEIEWFDKDGKAYCAVFNKDGQEYEVTFGLDGNFISEELELENEDEGEFEDDDKDDDEGCECEREDERDEDEGE